MIGMLRFSLAHQKELAAMKCLRIYATADGESHFDEVELPTTKMSVHPDAVPFDVSANYLASRVRLTQIPAGMREVAWHTVQEPNLAVRLDGSVEYETSDGEVRHVQAGSFLLVEDTHGKGHLSRHSAEAQTVIWISLPNGLDLPPA
jgi:hypothetical protein